MHRRVARQAPAQLRYGRLKVPGKRPPGPMTDPGKGLSDSGGAYYVSGPFCNNITCQLDSEGEVSAIDALARDVGEIEKPAQPLGTAWAASGAHLGARLLARGAPREVTRRAPRLRGGFLVQQPKTPSCENLGG